MFLISGVKTIWDTHYKLIVTLEYMVTDLEIKVCAGKHDHQKTTSFCAYMYTCILVIKCNGCLILLRNSAIGVRSPVGEEDFSSILCVQTGSGAHPASCTMGTGGPFPGGKARPGRDADHLPPSSAEVENE
jgi:hypothetical protein